MREMVPRRCQTIVISILYSILLLLLVGSPAQGESSMMLRGGIGLTKVTGDVGNDLVGDGFALSGEFFVALDPQIYIGGGIDLSFLGSQDWEFEGVPYDVTDSGVIFTFGVGGLVYLLPAGSAVRPYVGATAGRGGLAWSYTTPQQGEEADGIGFWYFAPVAGLSLSVAEKLALAGDLRYMLNAHDNTTVQGHNWDAFHLDGGHFVQLRAFVEIGL